MLQLYQSLVINHQAALIADTLIVGTRTVETYVTNILSKLGLQTRSQIAVWSVENGLAGKSR